MVKDFLFGLVTGIALSLCLYLVWETYRHVPVLIRSAPPPRSLPFRPSERRDLSTKFSRVADCRSFLLSEKKGWDKKAPDSKRGWLSQWPWVWRGGEGHAYSYA